MQILKIQISLRVVMCTLVLPTHDGLRK